jgi:subtilisin family serine protease
MKISIFKKALPAIAICLPFLVQAQSVKPNWQNLDLKTDSVFGISTEKAYTELLKGKKHVPVLVAVIDGGVDTSHEDLKAVIWNNPREIPGNGIDDEKDGYIDDVHGWGFIGGPKGNVNYDNLELVRVIRAEKPLYDNADTTKLSAADLVKYRAYKAMKADWMQQLSQAQLTLTSINRFKNVADTIATNMHNPNPTGAELKTYTPTTARQKRVLTALTSTLGDTAHFSSFMKAQLQPALEHYHAVADYQLNIDFDPRSIVGDDYTNDNQHNYGNNDVTGPDAMHGTHVSGIIGAVRDNNIGIKGVANDVMIMSVRTVPDGDERDKDVANAIRYAAANGAKVINMSFGKSYSWDKKVVDDAVKFAMSKDVLIIHAAGNDNTNLDSVTRYPNRTYADGSGIARQWIEVGASGPVDDETLKATFSCYGKTSVDVFAPGVNIYSTLPGSKYGDLSGTSMASPVVAGLAALIRSYYPKLSAIQVKEIILNSVTKVNHNIKIPGKTSEEVPFADLCLTGGIVNAYNALKLAATY